MLKFELNESFHVHFFQMTQSQEDVLIPLQYSGVQMFECVLSHHQQAASQKEFLISNYMSAKKIEIEKECYDHNISVYFLLNEIFSGDTFATHAKLHKHGQLPLPIIIPEADLKHPIIDLDLDTDNSVSCLSTYTTPQSEPNHPESSHCEALQSLFTSQMDTETEVDEDVSDEEDVDDVVDDDDDQEGENSQKSKEK